MKCIGTIQFVQVQGSALKLGEKPARIYDPSPLRVVDHLHLTPSGVLGQMADGTEIIDVHNANHPQTRFAGINGISLGFTAHYQQMRAQFGEHLVDGCGGENIIIATDRSYALEELGSQLLIQTGDGASVYLDDVQVAAPCVEFSHYVQRARLDTNPLAADVVRATLQFLNEGRRGFYATITKEPAIIQAGDSVFTLR